ncbi:MAG TPA: universal stress protein [Polyangiaceae bacterium]|nr:universal stress protein [Polyangiaceae bacterium]
MNTLKLIFCPTDFGPCAHAALRQALRLAEAHDARVDLAHVASVPHFASRDVVGKLGSAGSKPLLEIALAESNKQMDAVMRELTLAERRRVTTHCLVGSPAAAIIEHAQVHDVDLIVLGASGKARLSKYVLGGVAQKAIRNAHCPVLCVPDEEHVHGFQTILVGTDFSECSMHALRAACGMAARENAKVIVAHAAPTAWSLPPGLSVGVGEGTHWLELLQREAKQQLAEFVEKAKVLGFGVSEHELLIGSPAQSLLQYAQQHAVDLIVLGTHGRAPVARLMLGSVTETVVHNAQIPVLTVRGPATATPEDAD